MSMKEMDDDAANAQAAGAAPEEQPLHSDAFINSVVEHLPNMVFVKAAGDLRFVVVNKAGEELLGHRRDELLGKNDYDFFPRSEADFFTDKDREVLASGNLLDIPEEIIHTTKGPRILHTKKVPISDRDGVPKYLLGISEDITEQKMMEEQLQAVAAFQHAVMATIKEGLYTLDRQGLVTYINPAGEDLLGWTSAELIGRKMHDLTHYKYRDGTPFPAEECAVLQVLQQGETLMEHADSSIRKDGSFIDVVYSSAPLWRDGKIDGLVVIFRDVTEKKRAQEALQESEARFRAMADAAPILIWVSDARKSCTWFNRPWLDFTGRTMEQELGNGWTEVVHPDDFGRCVNIYTSSFDHRQPFTMEYRLRRYDGQYRWVMDHGIPRHAENGKFLGYIGSCIDVTDRKISEIQTEHFAEELERQVAVRTAELVQHQERLRELATELNLAEQRERRRLATDLHDHLQQILATCKLKLGHMRRLGELDAGRTRLTAETDELLTEALKYTRTLVAELSPPVLSQQGLGAGLTWLAEYMKRYGMSVSVSVPERRMRGLPDDQAILLFQSVRELLFNASKHAGTHEAWVTLEHNEGGLRIEVRDNGVGFAAASQSAPSEDPSKFGLFSIRERMSALGGSLHIMSSPEVGTRAVLLLPLIKTMEPPHEPSPGTAMSVGKEYWPNGLDGVVQVLLVDDHAMVRQGLRAILESYPDVHVIGEAVDGREALEAVRVLRPRVVIMDVNMPVMDGIEATTCIKQEFPDTIVVGLSVNGDHDNREAMMKAGAVDLLTKEAAVEKLHESIVRTINASYPTK
jgi:PAS domain S-box-containing protein